MDHIIHVLGLAFYTLGISFYALQWTILWRTWRKPKG